MITLNLAWPRRTLLPQAGQDISLAYAGRLLNEVAISKVSIPYSLETCLWALECLLPPHWKVLMLSHWMTYSHWISINSSWLRSVRLQNIIIVAWIAVSWTNSLPYSARPEVWSAWIAILWNINIIRLIRLVTNSCYWIRSLSTSWHPQPTTNAVNPARTW